MKSFEIRVREKFLEIEKKIKDISTGSGGDGICTYTQSGNTLVGSGDNGKFKATATAAYSSFTIGGISYAVKAGEESSVEIVNGVWYSFILDTLAKTINFKAGGGLSNSKLALATASEADVLSGKTFYAGNQTVKTGAMANNGAVSQSLSINGSYTIPAGYHNGSGKVTQSVTTKSAATYGAKTSDQTITSGQYLSGTQTIKKVEQSGLSAENIVSGKTITVSSNGSNLWSVTGTASGLPNGMHMTTPIMTSLTAPWGKLSGTAEDILNMFDGDPNGSYGEFNASHYVDYEFPDGTHQIVGIYIYCTYIRSINLRVYGVKNDGTEVELTSSNVLASTGIKQLTFSNTTQFKKCRIKNINSSSSSAYVQDIRIFFK